MGGDEEGRADIPPEDLNLLRGILVSSLSRENLGPVDIPPPPVAPRRRRKVTFLETKILLGQEAGATPVDPKQNGKPSTAKQGSTASASTSSLWFADDLDLEGKEAQGNIDREERLRILREKQNDERQRKLDELKQQALAAQKFREQKEEERRRRMEELRMRDTDRRHQVEERKRQIWEAERDRREAILRKNQEREARIESKRKNERSSIVFAFGSSAPRMLEPGDATSPYWATGRATSTTNVMTLSLSAAPGPLTRRSSERELDGSKKRATSAGGIERKPHHGLRSGELTPSRPQSSMSQHSVTSNLSSASASLRTRSMTPRRPRPVSIAVTGVTSDLKSSDRNIKSPSLGGTDKPPIPKVHATKKPSTTSKVETPPKKPEKSKSSKSSTTTTPKATTPLQSPSVEMESSGITVTTESTTSTTVTEDLVQFDDETKTETTTETKETIQMKISTDSIEEKQEVEETPAVVTQQPQPIPPSAPQEKQQAPQDKPQVPQEKPQAPQEKQVQPEQKQEPAKVVENGTDLAEADMTASMIAKVRITTEEAAKAALAERRRQAREQAEREAELERQRLEAERLAEEERLRKEEEEQRKMEEEQLRLLEEARRAEELRLEQAIEEAKKREEEENKRKEEELKMKIEKEEADKKAKEEAEKMRIEMEIRLKKEEEDRQARRKRVEAIMLRTRGKGSVTSNTATSKDGEDDDSSPPEDMKKSPEGSSNNDSNNEFINSERSHTDANTTNQQANNRHNGHHLNGSYNNSVTQNNVTNSLLVNLGEERVGQILDLESPGKLPSEQPQFIPQFQEKKEPPTVNDLLS